MKNEIIYKVRKLKNDDKFYIMVYDINTDKVLGYFKSYPFNSKEEATQIVESLNAKMEEISKENNEQKNVGLACMQSREISQMAKDLAKVSSKDVEIPSEEKEEQTKNNDDVIYPKYKIVRESNHKKVNGKIIAALGGVALVVGIATIILANSFNKLYDEIKKNNDNANNVPTPAPIASTVLPTVAPTAKPKAVVTTTEEPVTVPKALDYSELDLEHEYTTEEKINFVNAQVENFMNDMNNIEGISIDKNDALLQLSFINDLRVEDTNVVTSDYTLDFVQVYGQYWDKMTTNAKNYLCYNNDLYGQENVYNNVYSNYMCDKTDREMYSTYANGALDIVQKCYLCDKETVLEDANTFVTEVAQDLLIDQDQENCSVEAQYMINRASVNFPELLPVKTKIEVQGPVGLETIETLNKKKSNAKVSDPEHIIIFGETNLKNELDYLSRVASVNVTMKHYADESLCEETTKTKTLHN